MCMDSDWKISAELTEITRQVFASVDLNIEKHTDRCREYGIGFERESGPILHTRMSVLKINQIWQFTSGGTRAIGDSLKFGTGKTRKAVERDEEKTYRAESWNFACGRSASGTDRLQCEFGKTCGKTRSQASGDHYGVELL